MSDTRVTATKRGPYAKTRERREQVASAVLALVDELGHPGVTTSLVAERTGIAEATVLYHFPTRDHLLVAALQRADDVDLEQAGAVGALSLDLNALRIVADHELTRHPRRRHLLEVLRGQAAAPEHPAARYFQLRQERVVEVWEGLVHDLQLRGETRDDLDARAVALQIIGLWDGLMTLRRSDDSVDVGDLLVDAIRRLLGEKPNLVR